MAAVEFGLLFNDSKQCSFRKRGSGITPVCASTGQLPRVRTWSNRAMAFYPQYSYPRRSSVVLCYFFFFLSCGHHNIPPSQKRCSVFRISSPKARAARTQPILGKRQNSVNSTASRFGYLGMFRKKVFSLVPSCLPGILAVSWP